MLAASVAFIQPAWSAVHLAASALVITPVSSSKLLQTSAGLGAGPTLVGAIDVLCNVIAGIGAGAGVLGILIGGLMHTQAFHDDRAPDLGKRIIKHSLYGIGLMAGGPLLIKMVLALF